MKYCLNCGTKYLEDAQFCVECGQKIPIVSDNTIARVEENVFEEQVVDSKIEVKETSEPIEVIDDTKVKELRSHPKDSKPNLSELKAKQTKNNKKIPLIILGIFLLLGSLAFFIWNNASTEPEFWSTTASEDFPFTINVTIDENRYLAEAVTAPYEFMDFYALNNKIILEGDLLPTNNPNSQQIKVDTMSFELNDMLISEMLGDLMFEFSSDEALDWDSYDDYKNNLAVAWNSQTSNEKKSFLIEFSDEIIKNINSTYGYSPNQGLSFINELEKFLNQIIDSVYEVDGGVGFRISVSELKAFIMLLANYGDNYIGDFQEAITMMNTFESFLKFELADESSAFINIPLTNERLFFRKEIQYK